MKFLFSYNPVLVSFYKFIVLVLLYRVYLLHCPPVLSCMFCVCVSGDEARALYILSQCATSKQHP